MDVDGEFSMLHSCLPILRLPYLEQSKEAAKKQIYICTADQLLKKPGKLHIPSQGRRKYKHPQDNSNDSIVKEKLLIRKQSSRNK